MQGLGSEALAFLTAMLGGMTAVCAYSAIRKFRGVIRHTRRAASMEDLLYWTALSVYLFRQIYRTSSGSIRWFFVIGIMLGGALYVSAGRRVKRITDRFHKERGKNYKKTIEITEKKR